MTVTNPKTDPEILAFFTPDAVQICESEARVSEWPIRMWCRATGDNNPVYQDRNAARRHGHKDVFAPPGIRLSWASMSRSSLPPFVWATG